MNPLTSLSVVFQNTVDSMTMCVVWKSVVTTVCPAPSADDATMCPVAATVMSPLNAENAIANGLVLATSTVRLVPVVPAKSDW